MRPKWLHWEIPLNKEEITPFLHKLFQKLGEEETFSNTCYKARITLRSKQKHCKNRNLQRDVSHNHRNKNSQQNIRKWRPARFLKDNTSWPGEFILGTQVWFNTRKINHCIHHINRLKKKNDTTISIGAEKAFHRIGYLSRINTHRRRSGRELPQGDKGHLQKGLQ